jgi:hypothetical protein
VIRWSLSISLAVILAAYCAAQDKKPVPEKKPDPKKVEPEKELKPEKKPEDATPKPPAVGDDEEAKILERLKNNSRNAEERLGKPDTGDETRKLQDEVLKDIEELIKRLKNPPPPQQSQDQNQDQNSQSGGGGGSSSGSSGGGSQGQQRASGLSREQRRQMREQRRQQQAKNGGQGRQPMGGQQPQGGQGRQPMGGNQQANAGQGGQDNKTGGNTAGTQGGGGGRDPKGVNPTAEMYKDVWGHLPDKMRQEMDSYFKEKFMPKYNDLLKQYYSNIAEQNKKK